MARRQTRKMQRQRSVTQMLLPLQMAEEAIMGIKNVFKSNKDRRGSDCLSDLSVSGTSTKDSSHRYNRANSPRPGEFSSSNHSA